MEIKHLHKDACKKKTKPLAKPIVRKTITSIKNFKQKMRKMTLMACFKSITLSVKDNRLRFFSSTLFQSKKLHVFFQNGEKQYNKSDLCSSFMKNFTTVEILIDHKRTRLKLKLGLWSSPKTKVLNGTSTFENFQFFSSTVYCKPKLRCEQTTDSTKTVRKIKKIHHDKPVCFIYY